MSKIAFDMDGVLLPDYNKIPNLSEEEFFQQTIYAKPLINPMYEFDVVTARLEKWRPITEAWLRQMKRYPTNVFLKDTGTEESPAEYKYRISKQQGYDIFVESDRLVCKEMLELIIEDESDLRVIHFDDFITNNIIDSYV
jgi:hypothetical protein